MNPPRSTTSGPAAGIGGALLVVCTVLASPAHASPLMSVPVGRDVVLGGASHPRFTAAAINNPAFPVTTDFGGLWFGGLGLAQAYEVGDFNNLVDEAEALEAELDREDLTFEEAEAAKARFDLFLQQLGRDGYVKLMTGLDAPFMPIGFNAPLLGGTVALAATGYLGQRISILDAPIEVQPLGNGEYEIQSRTSAYAKAMGGVNASIGYSGGVLHRPDGVLFLGGRLNYYVVELAKTVIAFEDSEDEDTEDALEDDLDRLRRRSNAVGLDLGALFVGHNFRLGATMRNVNEPEMRYPPIGQDCGQFASEAAQRNCLTAASFSDRIALNETFRLPRQLSVEMGAFTASRTLFAATSWDVNSTLDAVGDEQQWLSVSGGYSLRWLSLLVPSVRLGYRTSLVAGGLDYYSVGLSLFRIIHLDASLSRQTVEHDGDEYPRSAFVSFGVEWQ